jgi:hypothetical protein
LFFVIAFRGADLAHAIDPLMLFFAAAMTNATLPFVVAVSQKATDATATLVQRMFGITCFATPCATTTNPGMGRNKLRKRNVASSF